MYSSIRTYLWGATSYIEDNDGQDCRGAPILRKCLRAIRRATRYRPRRKLAVTPQFIKLLKRGLDLCDPSQVELFAAITLAYHGLLRNSEYTRKRRTDGKFSATLLRCDIVVITLDGERNVFQGRQRRALQVNVRASKGDVFGTGAYVIIPETGSEICPVDAYEAACTARPTQRPQDPAFARDGKHVLRYQDVAKAIKKAGVACGMNAVDLGTHSLRSGGASCLAECGASDEVVKAYGRWASNCFLSYIRNRTLLSTAVADTIGTYNATALTFDQTYRFELTPEDITEVQQEVAQYHYH